MLNDNLIFLDTETTGNKETDRIIQLCWKQGFDSQPESAMFKAPVPIEIEAMAVHHITEKMLVDKPYFADSEACGIMKALFHPESEAIFVAHNAKFDADMLRKEGIEPQRIIDTLKVVRHMDQKDGRFAQYKLQYLRYALGIEVEALAHDAVGDVIVLAELFRHLEIRYSVEEMLEISSRPALIRTLAFGKHKGVLFSDVPKDYLRWLREQEWVDGDLRYTVDFYLNGNPAERASVSDPLQQVGSGSFQLDSRL